MCLNNLCPVVTVPEMHCANITVCQKDRVPKWHCAKMTEAQLSGVKVECAKLSGYPIIHNYSFSAGIDFSRQNLTSVDVRFWRLKSVPALTGLTGQSARYFILFCFCWQLWDEFGKQQPIGIVQEPVDTARVILFLASDAASFITGANLPVDAGWRNALADFSKKWIYSENGEIRTQGSRVIVKSALYVINSRVASFC